MNIRGPARAKSLAEGTYWEALKYVQFHEATSSLGVWSITAAAMAQDDVALADLCGGMMAAGAADWSSMWVSIIEPLGG